MRAAPKAPPGIADIGEMKGKSAKGALTRLFGLYLKGKVVTE